MRALCKKMKTVFLKIFPAYTESSIFIMTFSLFGVIFADLQVYDAVVIWLSSYFEKIAILFNEGVLANIWDLFSFVFVVPVIAFLTIFSALYLPFTDKDLRGATIFVLMAHLVILMVANGIYFKGNGSLINGLFVWYSILYFIVTFIRMRLYKTDELISPENHNGVEALILGVISLFIIFISIKLLKMNWIISYSLAFFYSNYIRDAVHMIFPKWVNE